MAPRATAHTAPQRIGSILAASLDLQSRLGLALRQDERLLHLVAAGAGATRRCASGELPAAFSDARLTPVGPWAGRHRPWQSRLLEPAGWSPDLPVCWHSHSASRLP